MKYVSVWTISPENYSATVERFKEGGPEIAGVKIIARLHEMGTGKGFTFFEADDPAAACRESLAWADLIDITVYPVVDDATIAQALGK